MNSDSLNSLKTVAASTPPVSVAGLSLWGMGLSDWVYALTIAWLLMQMGWFVWTKVQAFLKKKGK